MNTFGFPPRQGLYDPRFEKGSCGIGLVAHIKGHKSHGIIQNALEVLNNLYHRGAQGCDPCTGDGAGILFQLPHAFLAQMTEKEGFQLPLSGSYGVGMVFFPSKPNFRKECQKLFEKVIQEEGAHLLGWREVPGNNAVIGDNARSTEPSIFQVFITNNKHDVLKDGLGFERQLYVIRKVMEKTVEKSEIPGKNQFFISSLSSRTIVYKGLFLPQQLSEYYSDLKDPNLISALAIVHSRFSTNTFPTWSLAHPYRYICHNGEINTIKGNVNWMRARQGRLNSPLFGKNLARLFPIISENQSDSACLDNAIEFLVLAGRSLPHAMMMLIPEPWDANPHMTPERAGFYEYHSTTMEPWDGPAAVCFTDGTVVGATLDRNGLRPCRYQITTDDIVVLASEAGVLATDVRQIRKKGRLQPGQMFLLDTAKGCIIENEVIKREIVSQKPYRTWVDQHRISLKEIPESHTIPQATPLSLHQQQQVFGWSREELSRVILPMATLSEEPTSSMGNDTPLAVFSKRPQLLFKYFRQMFAQVTNPPIDPIREHLVMSLGTRIGQNHPLLAETPEACRHIHAQTPILTQKELEKIRSFTNLHFKSKTLRMLFAACKGPAGLRTGLADLCRKGMQAIEDGYKILILSDRDTDSEWAPIPSLLAVSSVHQYLIRKSVRAEVTLIIESGEPRDTHHFACLLSYGASAINPYLAFDSLTDLQRGGSLPEDFVVATAHSNYSQAINKGLLKIFSKMGVSTLQSYCGAQIFEVMGLNSKTVDRFFTGTYSRIEGAGLKEIAHEGLERHRAAVHPLLPLSLLDPGGDIHFQPDGEYHSWNPATISKLQHATHHNKAETFKEFSTWVDEENRNTTIRGLLDFNFPKAHVPIQEVELASEIVKRFTTGAMSFGALGKEAHETLALAMNRIGAKSNSGEGGEDPERFQVKAGHFSANSAIKQVASARFGVTAHYLVNAKELQIKMAQGAKPGEGGQLPGYKVDETIARLRYSTPGVQLISPPPHHDIYSIEDLAQLIFDLKNINPSADISVKLVAVAGVGTIAAGVAKAHADKILISGDSGGTGASPLSSIKYAGIPWEIGLAETHQTLVLNGLRDRVRIETDGQLKTGRDVVIATLLGAEEFGFSTAPLIVEGCIMMRKCHLNTCPVGIATHDPELRKKFAGQPEHIINYFMFVAEEVRLLMSKLGVRTLNEMIGRVELLKFCPRTAPGKAKEIDISRLIFRPLKRTGTELYCSQRQDHGLSEVLDHKLIQLCERAITAGMPVTLEIPIRNINRATGAMLAGQLTRQYGSNGLPEDTISIKFSGSAGQSFGAFLCRGITFFLEGECNDYVGKGLSGGKITVTPPPNCLFQPETTVLIGNTSLYGATGGEAYFYGQAGERFAVRNSGATAVVEGVGDHGCEYMTGGIVVVLGQTGKNFGAGMSGGVAFVLDEQGDFRSRCNLMTLELEQLEVLADQHLLREMIEKYLKYTGSTHAQSILNHWEEILPKFLKIIPTDYKRALLALKESKDV